MSDSEKIIYEINLGGSTVVTVFNGDGEEVPFLPQELEQLFFDRETVDHQKAEAVESALYDMKIL